jgi:hypothetical protein
MHPSRGLRLCHRSPTNGLVVGASCGPALSEMGGNAENHMFNRFQTVFRVRNDIVTWYEYRFRLISPSDFLLRARVRARMRASDLRPREWLSWYILLCFDKNPSYSAEFLSQYKYGIRTTNYYKNSFQRYLFFHG